MERKGSILIADTQFLTTEALRMVLEGEGYGVSVVHTQAKLREYLKGNRPCLIVTDHLLFGFGSTGDLGELGKLHEGVPILVLCNTMNKMQLKELNSAGIRNIALKTDEREELLQSVAAAIKGKKGYSGSVLDILLSQEGPAVHICPLTASEIEIVRLISNGLTTKEIAARKHVSFHTVTTHRKNIFRKLGVSSSPELMLFAIKAGLIDNIEYHI